MKQLKLIALLGLLLGAGASQATNLWVLNKTGQKLWCTTGYYPIWKLLGDEKVQSEWLEPNKIMHVRSHRLFDFYVKDANKKRLHIVSINGDPRILRYCEGQRDVDCKGDTLKFLKAKLQYGRLVVKQNAIWGITRPVVIVLTLDPEAKKAGKTELIVTELAHKWLPIHNREPQAIFYTIQKTPLAEIEKSMGKK